MVASMPPMTQRLTGSVANALFDASASHAKPLIAISVALVLSCIAWQPASNPKFRRMFQAAWCEESFTAGPLRRRAAAELAHQRGKRPPDYRNIVPLFHVEVQALDPLRDVLG